MSPWNKKVYAAAGDTTVFFGPGREEFHPKKEMPPFETYLTDIGKGILAQIPNPHFDEGVIGSFMPGRFLNQANIPGFLPFLCPDLEGKPCTGVEGACGTGGRAIAVAVRSILSGLSDSVLAVGFEIQNTMKPLYGADVLAGAAYYKGERKKGEAFFFPGIFSQRAGAYFEKYGRETARRAMARWYEQAILNARKHPKAQEYHNKTENLFEMGMTLPDPSTFLPYLNQYDCSKVSDGAAGIVIASEEGLKKLGIPKDQAIEIIALGESEADITKPPQDLAALSNSQNAVNKALASANITRGDIGLLEVHDCFSITALLSLEAAGFADPGKAGELILDGATSPEGRWPTNLSGGLIGFGHPTGASGVRQLVDLLHHSKNIKTSQPYGMMISMGGNDKTVTCVVVKSAI